MRIQISLHLGTDMLKPWRTSSLQGMGKSLADPGSRKGKEELYGSQTEDKSPYMSLISDSACLSMAQRGENELDQGPVAQEENGRQLKEKGKKEYRNHCEDPRTRKKEEIGPHNAGNGSTGTYGWERGVPVGRKMDQRGSHTAQDIECEKTGWTQPVFHVVSKDIEKPYVSEQMEKSAMEEHIAEEWNELLQEGELSRNPWV
jgi:hypothetical protein